MVAVEFGGQLWPRLPRRSVDFVVTSERTVGRPLRSIHFEREITYLKSENRGERGRESAFLATRFSMKPLRWSQACSDLSDFVRVVATTGKSLFLVRSDLLNARNCKKSSSALPGLLQGTDRFC